MATAGDGRAPSEGKRRNKKRIRREKSAGNQGRNPVTTELVRILKQMSLTMSANSIGTIIHSYLHPTTYENLPNELLTNIFIRLLTKQLAQMRSVTKSWNALLSHPSFIKSHVQRSINNNHHSLLAFNSSFSSYCERITTNSSPSPHLELTDSIKFIPLDDLPMRVVGSINGLICLSKMYHSSDIHIWNPSLSAISTLPLSHSIPPWRAYSSAIRFGFDPKTDDYKLVKVTGLCGSSVNVFTGVFEWLQVEVYSVRRGSWELITQPFPSNVTWISNTDYLCVDGYDGHLHWQNETGARNRGTIVAFDLGSETFREMPLPDSILDSNHGINVLRVLSGKLCEMSQCNDGSCEVWVMEEYGVPESWVKRHVFSQFSGGAFASRSIGFTLRGELLLCEWLSVENVGRLVLYDPIADKIKLTRTKQIPFKIIDYVDSLVWI